MSTTVTIPISIIIIILAGITAYYINNTRKLNTLRERLTSMWGKEPSQKYSETDMPSIQSYFRNMSSDNTDSFIDDITWNDLDMDRVFKRLNSTLSSVGEEFLYALLRKPCMDKENIAERRRLIEMFETSKNFRSALGLVLARLGKRRSVNITDMLFENEKASNIRSIIYRILSAMPLISIAITVAKPQAGVPLLVLSFIVNLTIYYKAKNDADSQLEKLSYIIAMLNCSKRIIDLKVEGIDSIKSTLKQSYNIAKSLNKRAFTLLYTSGDPISEYVKIIFLTELIAYESITSQIRTYREDLLKIYQCVGLLDSLAAIASYRKSVQYYCIPSLIACKTFKEQKLEYKNIYHPLLKDPVPNSLETSGSILLTGSNASGKSTFLKTTAINAIFAQTICTCLAESYSSPYFIIYSSMALKDNITNNESYYMAEIKSLKRIVDSLNNDLPCLCFVDEVLRGTNTVERIAASSQVLHYLSNANCLCIAATHDIELTYILEDNFENYHFQENFTDDEIIFDYTLYKGRSSTRNAIKLLRYMGYNESIVNQAEQRAQDFIGTGTWRKI